MAKELSVEERRKKILSIIIESDIPVSGNDIGKITDVSRQIIVQDIALLRTKGYPIISTPKGYMIEKQNNVYRVIKVCHTNDQVEDELQTIIDLGGIVCNVSINHRAYGKMQAELNIRNRRDISKFVDNIKSGKSSPLLNVTSGYHFHKIEAENEEVLDEIQDALKKKGYLADVLPYESVI